MSSNASYKGRRLRLPRLCNSYAALQESAQYTFADGRETLEVPLATGNYTMNQLYKFEPIFQPNFLIYNSPLCIAMFQRYEQFRIRKVAVRLTESSIGPSNQARSDVWIYWCPNHATFDADESKGQTFSTVTDLSEASRVQHVTFSPGRSVNLEVVPQVIYQNSITVGGVPIDQQGDGKMPWLDCTTANKDTTNLRMPIFYFRRPFAQGTGVPVHNPTFQVMVVAVIEFRNLGDDN